MEGVVEVVLDVLNTTTCSCSSSSLCPPSSLTLGRHVAHGLDGGASWADEGVRVGERRPHAGICISMALL